MTETVARALSALLSFAQARGLLAQADHRWAYNLLLDALGFAEPFPGPPSTADRLPETASALLEALCTDAVARGIIENSATRRELLATRLMGLLTPPPSVIIQRFEGIRAQEGAEAAIDWFYALQRANDYIHVDAIAKNQHFFHFSPFGELEITINLSKPEKDPRDIAALLGAPPAGYPKCMLCPENEGYAGRLDFPARQTLRLLPLTLCGEPWHLQYSPYLYYPEHCIVLCGQHRPMGINRDAFARLLDFLRQYPHYFIGSNADLPIVGGSILNHDHFQGGRHTFPLGSAPIYAQTRHPDAPGVRVCLLAWPITTLRLSARDPGALCDLAEHVLDVWRTYNDPRTDILAQTDDTPHNTITPIARRDGELYTLDLVLRNNRTSAEHPLGIFHPHAQLHHIKKENIGLIEVMGLFILPGRLVGELNALAEYLAGIRPMTPAPEEPALVQHWPWLTQLVVRHGMAPDMEAAHGILRAGLAEVCAQVLRDCGVFKLDDEGKAAMRRFLQAAGFDAVLSNGQLG